MICFFLSVLPNTNYLPYHSQKNQLERGSQEIKGLVSWRCNILLYQCLGSSHHLSRELFLVQQLFRNRNG